MGNRSLWVQNSLTVREFDNGSAECHSSAIPANHRLGIAPASNGVFATTRLLGSFPVRSGPTGRFLFPDQSTYSRNLPSFDQSGGALLFGVSSAICRHPGSLTTPYSGDRRPHGWTRKSSVAGHAQNNGSGGCDDLWIGLGFETLQVRMC